MNALGSDFELVLKIFSLASAAKSCLSFLWEEVAASTKCWTELLTVPGGSGKGEKCFGYLIDYEWDNSGAWSWSYAPVPEMQLDIVLPDCSTEGIALLPHTAGQVTLGISTSLDGDDTRLVRHWTN
jgi:hypothetical protein